MSRLKTWLNKGVAAPDQVKRTMNNEINNERNSESMKTIEEFAVEFENMVNMIKVAASMSDAIAYSDHDSSEERNKLASMMAGIVEIASLRNAELEDLVKGVTKDA